MSSSKNKLPGTSVIWFAVTPSDSPHFSTSGSYRLDNEDPVNFTIPVIGPTSATQFNQIYFETPKRPSASHTLTVTYLGNESTVPLALCSLIVHNELESNSGAQVPLGAIVGGVLGGVVVMVVVIILIWFRVYNRRQRLYIQKVQPFLSESLVQHPGLYHPHQLPLTVGDAADPLRITPFPMVETHTAAHAPQGHHPSKSNPSSSALNYSGRIAHLHDRGPGFRTPHNC